LTFDRAIIDARAAFAHGQVYVALSRCRTLNGIVLSSRIDRRCIIDSPAISDFVRGSVKNQPGPDQLAQSRKAYMQHLLTELFDFSSLAGRVNYCIKILHENSGALPGNQHERLEKSVSCIKTEITEVSKRFLVQLKEISEGAGDPEANTLLKERVIKGAVYFSEKLENNLQDILNGYPVETDNKTVRKSIEDAFERTRKDAVIKLACLNSAKSGFQVSKYLDARAKAAIDIPPVRKKPGKQADDLTGVIRHPVLFRHLKEWRNKKAGETGLPHYRILRQKALTALCNDLPQTLASFKHIKGIGKKFRDEFRMELLEIITEYCQTEKIYPPAGHPADEGNQKMKKVDSKRITYELLQDGNSISQIAEKRNLSIATIENHLSYFVGTGEILVSKLVSQELIDLISGHLLADDDLRMGPVKELLGEKVSWSDIRFVKSHLIYLKSSKSKS
jgi:hypothetical protein